MKISYYPGCSQEGSSADYGKSTGALCAALGIELQEIEGWNCCGSTPAHSVSSELSAAFCIRNLDLAKKEGHDLVATPCPSCLSNLRMARHKFQDEEFRKRVNELLDEPAAESLPEAISIMQLIGRTHDAKSLSDLVKKPLKGLRVAPYYGCLMSRPAKIMDFGDPENPTLMESLLSACGAEIIDFPLKTVCCGASYGIPKRPLAAENSGKILELAKEMGADCIAVACPLCQMNLDLRQNQAARAMNANFDIPIPYFTQLMGLALGISPEHLGMSQLVVSANSIINKIDAGMAQGDAA